MKLYSVGYLTSSVHFQGEVSKYRLACLEEGKVTENEGVEERKLEKNIEKN